MIYYIDIDDTLIRTVGSKAIPMVRTIEFINSINQSNDSIYLWSRGGAEYCRQIAEKLNITSNIKGYLPKPDVLIDDCDISQWNFMTVIHPNSIPATQQGDAPDSASPAR